MARFGAFICLLALTCLLALLAGCGGGNDKEDAEQTVRDFVTAVNERDADAYCDDLITKEFREKSTFATGDRASDATRARGRHRLVATSTQVASSSKRRLISRT